MHCFMGIDAHLYVHISMLVDFIGAYFLMRFFVFKKDLGQARSRGIEVSLPPRIRFAFFQHTGGESTAQMASNCARSRVSWSAGTDLFMWPSMP